MKKNWVVFLSILNSLLVIGLVVWLVWQQNRAPEIIDLGANQKPLDVPTLVAEIEAAPSMDKKLNLLNKIPADPEQATIVNPLLEELMQATATEATFTETQMIITALKKWTLLQENSRAGIERALSIANDPSASLYARDYALRVAFETILSGLKEEQLDKPGANAIVAEMAQTFLPKSETDFPATILIGMNFLQQQADQPLPPDVLFNAVKTVAAQEPLLEANLLTVLVVIEQQNLMAMEDLARAQLTEPMSDAVYAQAARTLYTIGDETTLAFLESHQPQTASRAEVLGKTLVALNAKLAEPAE